MQQGNTFIIAKEGWKYLAALLVAFLFFTLIDADVLQLLTFAVFVFVAYLYRNPERVVPYYQSNSIVAVADGKVRSIETVTSSPLMEAPAYKIVIQSKCLDTALLRAPFDSQVDHIELRRGNRLSIRKPLADELNEKALLRFSNLSGNTLAVEHLLEQSIDDITLHVFYEKKVVQGSRYGLMIKGTHTLYLPDNSRIAVNEGDDVRAGESLIGYFS